MLLGYYQIKRRPLNKNWMILLLGSRVFHPIPFILKALGPLALNWFWALASVTPQNISQRIRDATFPPRVPLPQYTKGFLQHPSQNIRVTQIQTVQAQSQSQIKYLIK